jgi:hypothetical protein
MRQFTDWGRTKESVSVYEEYPENEVYLETGCPKFAMVKYLDEGKKVFICPGKVTNDLRKELGWAKSDETDAKVIQELFHRDPSVFVEFTLPQQAELRKNLAMSEYETVTKDLTALKNRHSAIVKEFGPNPTYEEIIKQLGKYKFGLIKKVQPLIVEELKQVDHIKGVGPTLTARVLAMAHPNKFPNKSAYLKYCGYTEASRKSNKFHRGVKSVYFLIAEQTLKATDPVYRPIYDKAKEREQQKTCADCWLTKNGHKCKKRKSDDQPTCPIRAHTVALNRVATALAREFWMKLHNIKGVSLPEEFFAMSKMDVEPRVVSVDEYFK